MRYLEFCDKRKIGERNFYGIAKKKSEALMEFRNRSESGENVGLVAQR